MGRKRSGSRKQIYLCVAVLIFLSPLACSLSKTISTKMADATGDEARVHLVLGKTYLAQGEYKDALKENEKVISLAGKNVPVDEALFYVGLIYAHPANSARDYGKSMISFRRLIRDYPGSPLVEQAKTVVGILQENNTLDRSIDKLNRIIEEQKRTVDRSNSIIDEQKKTVDRLNNLIDELKQVDIGVEQKKRDKVK
jgi:outer membrane protein assembly factor BamD (BamD/ComL family)